jgi:hypothetical protein
VGGVAELFVTAYRNAGVPEDDARAASVLVREIYVDPSFWIVFDDTRPALTRPREAGRARPAGGTSSSATTSRSCRDWWPISGWSTSSTES